MACLQKSCRDVISHVPRVDSCLNWLSESARISTSWSPDGWKLTSPVMKNSWKHDKFAIIFWHNRRYLYLLQQSLHVSKTARFYIWHLYCTLSQHCFSIADNIIDFSKVRWCFYLFFYFLKTTHNIFFLRQNFRCTTKYQYLLCFLGLGFETFLDLIRVLFVFKLIIPIFIFHKNKWSVI